ncbi:hypothetical protein KXQ82_13680 [Mucilaginibacter sp. HMF5004]|uniref:hypothetical protein n=1 Tax=Mucilaginibacter rivuli TaxID=2857527 RepID=UPI001C5CD3F6|nr:hypothetical protein [Mucilaginibacter rivuli]MBW4890776.1 hypothetical protein [Mucilaginibacter rivuli]
METNDQSSPETRNGEQGKNKVEKDLKRSFLFGDNQKVANTPGMEGQGMGGHKFGEENHPPTGNDPNNPSQNAGSTNAYLAQTRPLEEHPENNNFKVPEQQGEPDYDGAQRYASGSSAVEAKDDADDKGPSEYME